MCRICAGRLPGCQALRRLPARWGPFQVSANFTERSPLGCHSKPSRIRLPRRLPTVAAPALASVAAAICLSPQALANPSAAPAAAQNAVVAGYQSGASAGHLLAAEWWAEQAKSAGPSSPSRYRVQPGDSLSSIAGRVYHDQDAWPVLYWANHKQIRWRTLSRPDRFCGSRPSPSRSPPRPRYSGRPHRRPRPPRRLSSRTTHRRRARAVTPVAGQAARSVSA